MPLGTDQKYFFYLKVTSDRGLRYWKASEAFSVEKLEVNIWSDADWAGDRVDRKSTSGALPAANGWSIVWSSKQQVVVSISTMEAEFIAGATSVSECE